MLLARLDQSIAGKQYGGSCFEGSEGLVVGSEGGLEVAVRLSHGWRG